MPSEMQPFYPEYETDQQEQARWQRRAHDYEDVQAGYQRAIGFVGMVSQPDLMAGTIESYAREIADGLELFDRTQPGFQLGVTNDELVRGLEEDIRSAIREQCEQSPVLAVLNDPAFQSALSVAVGQAIEQVATESTSRYGYVPGRAVEPTDYELPER